jgi:hypothetical protein
VRTALIWLTVKGVGGDGERLCPFLVLASWRLVQEKRKMRAGVLFGRLRGKQKEVRGFQVAAERRKSKW